MTTKYYLYTTNTPPIIQSHNLLYIEVPKDKKRGYGYIAHYANGQIRHYYENYSIDYICRNLLSAFKEISEEELALYL